VDTRDHGCVCLFREPDPGLAVITHAGNLQGRQDSIQMPSMFAAELRTWHTGVTELASGLAGVS
jgi:hypothetical protein